MVKNNGNIKKLKEDIKRKDQRINTLKSKIEELNAEIQNNINNNNKNKSVKSKEIKENKQSVKIML